MEVVYTAVALNTGGRNGHVRTSDGIIDMDVRTPKAMGGPEGNYTNPEQLFAAGYASCFSGALTFMALQKKIRIAPEVTCMVDFIKSDEGGFKLGVKMSAIIDGIDQETAEALMTDAHRICPYSVATRGNIEVQLEVSVR